MSVYCLPLPLCALCCLPLQNNTPAWENLPSGGRILCGGVCVPATDELEFLLRFLHEDMRRSGQSSRPAAEPKHPRRRLGWMIVFASQLPSKRCTVYSYRGTAARRWRLRPAVIQHFPLHTHRRSFPPSIFPCHSFESQLWRVRKVKRAPGIL